MSDRATGKPESQPKPATSALSAECRQVVLGQVVPLPVRDVRGLLPIADDLLLRHEVCSSNNIL